MANMYETIGSSNVRASSTPYKSVGSPLLYTYANVNTSIKVVLPSNDQPVTSSESSQQSMDSKHDKIIETSQDGTEKIVYNAALWEHDAYARTKRINQKTAPPSASHQAKETRLYTAAKQLSPQQKEPLLVLW